MPLILFGLFVLIPILEIATFIQVGSVIGMPMTLVGILFTAVLGAFLVRQQGFKVLRAAQENLANQKSPAEQMIHGVFILIAGLLLLTPGFLTDTIGFLFLIPSLRLVIASKIWRWMKATGSFTINSTHQTGGMENGWRESDFNHRGFNKDGADKYQDGEIIDGDAVEIINNRNIEKK